MVTAQRVEDGAAIEFRAVAFHGLPLVCLATAAAAAASAGPAWSERWAPLPWIVSLGFVGLPHGAADFAISRTIWHGRPLAALWLVYAAMMAAVAAGFAAAPAAAIVTFALLSCWHFGAAHLDAETPAGGSRVRLVAAVARGGAVLAVPLAAWPAATSRAAAELVALTLQRGPAMEAFAPAAVRTAGLALGLVTVAAVVLDGIRGRGRPGGLRAWAGLLVELTVIAALGWFADPLFSVGVYFLVWHGWRQMEPLAETVTGAAARSWPELAAALVRIHAAALPLLVPTWAAIGAAWWRWSAGHAPRDLAILSIAAYLVVTPAHELLGELLRAGAVTAAAPAGRPSPAGPAAGPRPDRTRPTPGSGPRPRGPAPA